ncbi:unnamed protein product [Rangifer tarandus platyrhynchus]|uniref:Uncharacterized protein n=1 Tax=Rangifer tarandus platyrhynchus TaxID=3082113 RepID=A0AC59Z4Z2_RANTA
MAGERTRRFTRSLLRPGQAAELRHSAASAAAVAVSSRQQQRVCAPPSPLATGASEGRRSEVLARAKTWESHLNAIAETNALLTHLPPRGKTPQTA